MFLYFFFLGKPDDLKATSVSSTVNNETILNSSLAFNYIKRCQSDLVSSVCAFHSILNSVKNTIARKNETQGIVY